MPISESEWLDFEQFFPDKIFNNTHMDRSTDMQTSGIH